MIPIVVVLSFLLADYGFSDDLFRASGRKLRQSQKSYIEGRVKRLRSDSDYRKRFETVQYLIGLDDTVLPFLIDEVDHNSNPMLVRCAVMALSEIGGAEVGPALERVISSSKKGRDEKVMAALGLGKQENVTDMKRLRSLIDPGERRFVRKAAALSLARRKDAPSASKLLKLAKREREDELASINLLSALMIGGEEIVKAVPQLFRSSKTNRRRVLALGSTFLAEPALLPTLVKYGNKDRKDKKLQCALAVAFGRFPSQEAVSYLTQIIKGEDPKAAADALYSMGLQDEKRALEIYSETLQAARSSYVKAHAILALMEAGMADRFIGQLRQAMKDSDALVRSAAAFGLINSGDGEAAEYIVEMLKKQERRPQVVADLLLALGLVGGVQHVERAEYWAQRNPGKEPGLTALLVMKVLKGKTDPRVLEDRLDERLNELSAKWHLRFRDRVMEEIWWGLELDRIVRTSFGETGGGSELPQEGGEEDPGGEDPGGEDPGGDEPGGDEPGGEDPGGDSGGDDPSPPSGTFSDEGTGKKIQYRYEVMEWDLAQWFTHYSYFPDSFFQAGQ